MSIDRYSVKTLGEVSTDVIVDISGMVGVWIFSGTTQSKNNLSHDIGNNSTEIVSNLV